MKFEADFFSKKLILSEKCKYVLGAVRDCKIYEMELIEFFYNEILKKENLNEEIILLDIGSNTGAFCFLPLIDGRFKSYAFEPNPFTFSILKENIELNNIDTSVQAFNIGLWDEKKTLELKIPKDLSDSGLATFGENPSRFVYDDKNGDYNTVSIECDTLDNIVEGLKLKTVTAIKIDTEGSELNILKGALEVIRKFKPLILLEYFDGNTKQFGYEKEKILELLQEFGYDKIYYPTQSDILVK